MFVAGLAIAQTTVQSTAGDPPAFRPTLGDLMTAYVQPRHLKIGLAGQARNWEYLAYEVHELEETFEAIERHVPRYRNVAMSDLMKMIEDPLKAVEGAIKARDGAAFDAAYTRLTDGCNACHVATAHRMIVIVAPRSSSFPNQSFAPPRP
ncbi:MAG: hypothetical protein ACKOEC_11385 [Acidimicrobiia bacterium]